MIIQIMHFKIIDAFHPKPPDGLKSWKVGNHAVIYSGHSKKKWTHNRKGSILGSGDHENGAYPIEPHQHTSTRTLILISPCLAALGPIIMRVAPPSAETMEQALGWDWIAGFLWVFLWLLNSHRFLAFNLWPWDLRSWTPGSCPKFETLYESVDADFQHDRI